MKPDAVIKNLYEIRDAHAKAFGYNLNAIAADLKQKEQQNKHPIASLKVKRKVAALAR
jgi:hypothetical protein